MYSKRQTMCPSRYYQSANGPMVTHGLGYMMYDYMMYISFWLIYIDIDIYTYIYILYSSYFCEIWALCMSWVTSNQFYHILNIFHIHYIYYIYHTYYIDYMYIHVYIIFICLYVYKHIYIYIIYIHIYLHVNVNILLLRNMWTTLMGEQEIWETTVL